MNNTKCHYCHRRITEDSDLTTVAYFLKVLPYHKECIDKQFIGVPLDGRLGNIIVLVSLIFVLISFFKPYSLPIFIWFLYPIVMRIYSHLKFRYNKY